MTDEKPDKAKRGRVEEMTHEADDNAGMPKARAKALYETNVRRLASG